MRHCGMARAAMLSAAASSPPLCHPNRRQVTRVDEPSPSMVPRALHQVPAYSPHPHCVNPFR